MPGSPREYPKAEAKAEVPTIFSRKLKPKRYPATVMPEIATAIPEPRGGGASFPLRAADRPPLIKRRSTR